MAGMTFDVELDHYSDHALDNPLFATLEVSGDRTVLGEACLDLYVSGIQKNPRFSVTRDGEQDDCFWIRISDRHDIEALRAFCELTLAQYPRNP